VLVVGSGGLSHDPPVPSLQGAGPELRERLLRGLSGEAQNKREADIVAVSRAFAAGETLLTPLAPEFDRQFQALIESNRFEEVDSWEDGWLTQNFGRGVHEVRTWIAAFSALAASGPYDVSLSYYRAIPEWLTGFGIMTGTSQLDTGLPQHAGRNR
jgi:2,3-dihydroxyphenylpropionate 1,2-dioxygenase